MPSTGVYDIAQDNSGLMWFISPTGPINYNGKEWKSFPDSLNLPSSEETKIIVLDEKIWVAGLNDTTFSVQYYVNSQWHNIEVPNANDLQSAHVSIGGIQLDNGTKFLLGISNKLLEYNVKDKIWSTDLLNGTRINSIKSYKDFCHISTSDGLYRYDYSEIKKIELPYSSFPNEVILTSEI